MSQSIRFMLNGQPISISTDPERSLLDVIRYDLNLTGAKYGCGEGQCGTCTVIADRQAIRTCILPVSAVEGRNVATIEGLARGSELHPVQEAFLEHGALQCGYCTPGMILSCVALLEHKPKPTEREIVTALEGNICRCGMYSRIVQAVKMAAQKMNGMNGAPATGLAEDM